MIAPSGWLWLTCVANGLVAVLFALVAVLIGLSTWGSRRQGVNPFAIATMLIFVTCGITHGVRAIQYWVDAASYFSRADLWIVALTDLATAAASLYYLRLRGRYGWFARDPDHIMGVERRLSELERIKSEKDRLITELEQANAIKDEFLSIAAHELKTPITSIKGFAQMLSTALDVAQSEIPDTDLGQIVVHQRRIMRRSVATITRQSIRMTGLIEQLLDVSRLDTGRLDLERTPLNFAHLLREVVDSAQERTTRHQINFAAAGEMLCYVDAARIEQVLMNVLDNAIKYSPEGGEINVVALHPPHEDYITVEITDQGIGIAPEERARIFDRFYQSSVASRTAGLGLGLFISRQFVTRHGGEITASSALGGGTLIRLRLPTALAEAPCGDLSAHSPRQGLTLLRPETPPGGAAEHPNRSGQSAC